MEYLDGDDLRLWAMRQSRLPPVERYQRFRRLAISLAEALEAIHKEGLVHRDIKPSNIRVIGDLFPVITDFGVVKDLEADGQTAHGVMIGTPTYASPEQIRGLKIDSRSDLYSLGCTLYTILAGRPPFTGETHESLIKSHVLEDPSPPSVFGPTIPPDLEHHVLKLMAKSPEDRYQTARELIDALSLSPVPLGVPLAGRKQALVKVADALGKVSKGERCLVEIRGTRGTGRSWLMSTLEQSAVRRGIPFMAHRDRASFDAIRWRLSSDEPILIAVELNPSDPSPYETSPDIEILLEPLGRADVRRSVVASSKAIQNPALLAEELFKLTGGLPALLVPALELLAEDPSAVKFSFEAADPWLNELDLDALEILQAISAMETPVSEEVIEKVTLIPPETAIDQLIKMGLIKKVVSQDNWIESDRYQVTAGLIGEAALKRAPDLNSLQARIAKTLERDNSQSSRQEWETRFLQARDQRDLARSTRVLIERGQIASLQGSLEKAETLYQEVISQEEAGSEAMGEVCNALGRLALQKGDLKQGLTFLEEAADIFSKARMQLSGAKARLSLALAYSLNGEIGRSLNTLSNTITISRAMAAPLMECRCMRLQGLIFLELGATEQAAKILADLSALAHAANLPREQAIAHILRAQSSLDGAPGAAAVNRLNNVFKDKPNIDGWGFYGQALLARASILLGDSRTFKRIMQAIIKNGHSDAPMDIRTSIQVAKAAYAGNQRELAKKKLAYAQRDASTAEFKLLVWLAEYELRSWSGEKYPIDKSFLEGCSEQKIQNILNNT